MTGAIVRRATRADIPAMSAIRLAVTENVLSDPARVTLQMYEDYLELLGRGWVAEVDGRVAAFCYAERAGGTIWALFVDRACEGRGLARRLLGVAVAWLFEQGHDTVSLSTGSGTRADRFYAQQGWQREPLGAAEAAYTLTRGSAAAKRARLDADVLIKHAI